MEFETINNFFVVTATIGILGIYVGFRGTLTANFLSASNNGAMIRKILIFPVGVFLPVALVYSFYPRYVLKRIYEYDIIKKVRDLEVLRSSALDKEESIKERIGMDKTIAEIKEKLMLERSQFPIISLKDSPSLLVAILMLIQLVAQYDSVISGYLKSLFN